jgi:S1-C subfamily serine protease
MTEDSQSTAGRSRSASDSKSPPLVSTAELQGLADGFDDFGRFLQRHRARVITYIGLAPFVLGLLLGFVESLERYSYSPVNRRSIVVVEVESAPVDLTRPWARQDTFPCTGTGSILPGHRILTAAHVVDDAVTIDVARADNYEVFRARLVAVWHDVDLALLTVDNPRFFEGAVPLELQDLPPADDEWIAIGFPDEKLEYASGRFAEVDRAEYWRSDRDHLEYTLDMNVKPGYSGGPLTSGGRMTGVVVSGSDYDHKTYAVPAQVVRHFLEDAEDDRVDGTAALIGAWQSLENAQIRAYYGLEEGQTGVIVKSVFRPSRGRSYLLPNDIVLAIDGYNVGNDGKVAAELDSSISFEYLIDRKQVGDTVTVDLLRDRRPLTVDIPLYGTDKDRTRMVQYLGDETPSYLVVGGCVFSTLTRDYIREWDSDSMSARAWVYHAGLVQTHRTLGETRDEAVVLVSLLPDATTDGYDDCIAHVVTHVNGRWIGSMRDLAAAFTEGRRDYHHVQLQPDDKEIIISKAVLGDRQQAILNEHQIPADRSPDLAVTTAGR